jgi:thiosulfate dehydrogenase [quinone] large subunit
MQTGEALKGFWTNAVKVPETGKPPIAFDWYRGFIQGLLDSGAYVWFAKLVAVGELLIGVALIVGAFVGIAAFAGGLMNWNFLMAGSASTNPLLFLAAILLVLAWKTAGYYGVDRFLLPRLGTPWGRKAPSASPVGKEPAPSAA